MMRGSSAIAILSLALAGCATEPPAAFEDSASRAVSIERRSAHLFQAQNHRDLVIRENGVERARQSMATDTGGDGRSNLYRLLDGTLLVADFKNSYVVDVEAGNLRVDDARRREGAFLGAFDEDVSGRWRFIPAAERDER